MKAKKLTLKDCFKYPNARLQAQNIGDFSDIESFLYVYHNTNEPPFIINDFTLILRPLSSLTDEEKKYIQFHLHRNIPIYWDKINKIYELVYVLERECIIPLCDYLRSINIDIDEMEKKGKAVYE